MNQTTELKIPDVTVLKKVSICMLAYNTSRFIGAAIESALAQKTNFDFELVISDNNSEDNTRQIIREYAAKYPDIIRPIFNPVNIGMSANFVNTFKNCEGEYIAVLDSDDYWCDPFKLQKQVDFLDNNKDYGVAYSDCKVINESGEEIEWEEMKQYRENFTSGDLFFSLMEASAFIPNLTTCFRKELITEELKKNNLWYFEDWWLWMRIAAKSKLHYMDAQMACYRQHSGNSTQTRFNNKKAIREYKRKAYTIYYNNILYFDDHNNKKLTSPERKIMARKIMMLLYRRYGSVKMKWKVFPLFFKYFPGFKSFFSLLGKKMKITGVFTFISQNIVLCFQSFNPDAYNFCL